jgi:type I restriction enzyme S subunit
MHYQFYKETNLKEVVLNDEVVKIPDDWEVVKLKDLFKVITGTTPSTKEKKYWINEVNWYTPEDLSSLRHLKLLFDSKRKISKIAIKKYNLKILPKGSLIISTRAPIGYVGLIEKEGCFNQGCKGLIIKDRNNVNPRFYLYFLSQDVFINYLNLLGTGSTFKEISKEKLENLDIILPSLQEQQAIASILQKFDQLLEIYNQEINTLQRIKKALMKKFFTEGIFKHEKFKEVILNDEIIKIPEEWEVKKLKEVVRIEQGKSFPTKELEDKGNYPVFGANGIIGWQNKNFMYRDPQVLIACRGSTCGVVNYTLPFSWVNHNAMVLIPLEDNKLIKRFLFYLLNWFYENNKINKVITGTGQPQITINKLSDFQIFLPPLEEQKAIAEKLSKIDELIELKKEKKEQVQKFKKVMMKKLLSGEVRVKV